MCDLVILVPVLARPHRVKPFLKSVRNTVPDARVLFLTNTNDVEERKVLWDVGAESLDVVGRWARKLNVGIEVTTEPHIFLGADDLEFKPGWYEEAKALFTDQVQVVGVNDLIRRNRPHATHFLITREYAELPGIDNGPLLHEGYWHWWVDNELMGVAQHRGAYAYAEQSHVEHLHPLNRKAPQDSTYDLGNKYVGQDRHLFIQRSKLWS